MKSEEADEHVGCAASSEIATRKAQRYISAYKLSGKEAQRIQGERVREGDNQLLNAGCLKVCQALADSVGAADQRAA